MRIKSWLSISFVIIIYFYLFLAVFIHLYPEFLCGRAL